MSAPIIDFASALESAIEAGQTVVEGNVVKVIADNGAEIGNSVLKVIEGGNGNATTTNVMTGAVEGGVATTSGVSIMALDVGTMGAALAPALGIVAGVGLYNLAPEFWTNVSNALVNAGKTIGGKVVTYFDGKNIFFDKDTIEIFKNQLYNTGIYSQKATSDLDCSPLPTPFSFGLSPRYIYDENPGTEQSDQRTVYVDRYLNSQNLPCMVTTFQHNESYGGRFEAVCADSITPGGSHQQFTYDGRTVYYTTAILDTIPASYVEGFADFTNIPGITGIIGLSAQYIAWTMVYGLVNDSPVVQPDATYPVPETEFPLTYPDWYPLNYPTGAPSGLPEIYPIKYPGVGPDGYPQQDPAQNPDPESIPDVYPVIIPDLPLPDPNPDPSPEPEPEPDPDPQPEPDPMPDEDTPTPDPDPIDPNPDPTPAPIIPDPSLPTTVSSGKLFTVYNPSSSQLDSLGGYLWDGSLMETLKKIWQDPLDGIISLIQVYVTPTTGGSQNIILGYLDSGVSAPVVSSQFVTVDCGTVQIKERKKNATDYPPFVSLHVYLPFIGIVELDVNEFMNGSMSIKYKVDVYTGTCIAEIKSTRSPDMTNGNKVYEFSGNCSQQIPLTSGNATGALSALVSGVGAGLAIASGGGLGVVAGASMVGHSLTHEMFHVNHSGNLSANAGILGNRKPFVILGRAHNYDANGYNTIYGYPSNKTVNLGNCSGFTRVKDCHLKTTATQPEYEEIMSLLKSGVIM